MEQWKNFENRPTFVKVVGRGADHVFFWLTVYVSSTVPFNLNMSLVHRCPAVQSLVCNSVFSPVFCVLQLLGLNKRDTGFCFIWAVSIWQFSNLNVFLRCQRTLFMAGRHYQKTETTARTWASLCKGPASLSQRVKANKNNVCVTIRIWYRYHDNERWCGGVVVSGPDYWSKSHEFDPWQVTHA